MSLDDKSTAVAWINSHSYEFTEWGWDPTGSNFWNYSNAFNGGSNSIPQSYIIDRDGNVRYAKVGSIGSPGQFTVVIDELI
jgi:hypothetical protein